ncbi:hypothetical protein DRO69_00885 [Candidatus Bathyarchaeota archaeon]|nr:MAG: hypothetical protein DRO69_00885 [Candidatus Bathyarchaeota archaeon]
MEWKVRRLKYNIVSIIASLKLDLEIDLIKLREFLHVRNYSRQPHFLAFRLPQIKSTILIYKRGTITFAGLKRFSDLSKVKQAVLSKLREFGLTVPSHPSLRIGNIVAIADAGKRLDIEGLSKSRETKQMEYNPEIFPGLIYRKPESTLVLIVFGSGKIVLTGAKSVSDIKDGLSEIQKLFSPVYETNWSPNTSGDAD